MECRRIISDRYRYWNIKGWGHFVVSFCVNYLSSRLLAVGHVEQMLAPLWHHCGEVSFHG
jgi:hypothetical protein